MKAAAAEYGTSMLGKKMEMVEAADPPGRTVEDLMDLDEDDDDDEDPFSFGD